MKKKIIGTILSAGTVIGTVAPLTACTFEVNTDQYEIQPSSPSLTYVGDSITLTTTLNGKDFEETYSTNAADISSRLIKIEGNKVTRTSESLNGDKQDITITGDKSHKTVSISIINMNSDAKYINAYCTGSLQTGAAITVILNNIVWEEIHEIEGWTKSTGNDAPYTFTKIDETASANESVTIIGSGIDAIQVLVPFSESSPYIKTIVAGDLQNGATITVDLFNRATVNDIEGWDTTSRTDNQVIFSKEGNPSIHSNETVTITGSTDDVIVTVPFRSDAQKSISVSLSGSLKTGVTINVYMYGGVQWEDVEISGDDWNKGDQDHTFSKTEPTAMTSELVTLSFDEDGARNIMLSIPFAESSSYYGFFTLTNSLKIGDGGQTTAEININTNYSDDPSELTLVSDHPEIVSVTKQGDTYIATAHKEGSATLTLLLGDETLCQNIVTVQSVDTYTLSADQTTLTKDDVANITTKRNGEPVTDSYTIQGNYEQYLSISDNRITCNSQPTIAEGAKTFTVISTNHSNTSINIVVQTETTNKYVVTSESNEIKGNNSSLQMTLQRDNETYDSDHLTWQITSNDYADISNEPLTKGKITQEWGPTRSLDVTVSAKIGDWTVATKNITLSPIALKVNADFFTIENNVITGYADNFVLAWDDPTGIDNYLSEYGCPGANVLDLSNCILSGKKHLLSINRKKDGVSIYENINNFYGKLTYLNLSNTIFGYDYETVSQKKVGNSGWLTFGSNPSVTTEKANKFSNLRELNLSNANFAASDVDVGTETVSTGRNTFCKIEAPALKTLNLSNTKFAREGMGVHDTVAHTTSTANETFLMCDLSTVENINFNNTVFAAEYMDISYAFLRTFQQSDLRLLTKIDLSTIIVETVNVTHTYGAHQNTPYFFGGDSVGCNLSNLQEIYLPNTKTTPWQIFPQNSWHYVFSKSIIPAGGKFYGYTAKPAFMDNDCWVPNFDTWSWFDY